MRSLEEPIRNIEQKREERKAIRKGGRLAALYICAFQLLSVLCGMTSLTLQYRSVPARGEVSYLFRKYLPHAVQGVIPTKIAAFLHMTPCNLAGIYGRFEDASLFPCSGYAMKEIPSL